MHSPFGKREKDSGFFITLEGGEGSGKTTQAELLKDYFLLRGIDTIMTSEPGGTELGKMIRDILLDNHVGSIEPVAEACLFAADRAQQVKRVIKPALEKGWIVIGDRYIDSSLVYQGVARGCGMESVMNLNEWAAGGLMPDMTILIDVPVAVGLQRLAADLKDRIEQETKQFHENIRFGYQTLMKMSGGRILEVDGQGDPEAVHRRIQEILKDVV